MNHPEVLAPHHEFNIQGNTPWTVPPAISMNEVQADPAARCCKECGRRLLLLLLQSSSWVARRTEHVCFRDDRSVVRRVKVEFNVPEQAPVFRGDDDLAYSLVPLSVMRRKTLVNFELQDEDGRTVIQPSLRQNQAITESVLLACADAVSRQAGNGECAAAAIMFESAHPTHLPPALWTAVAVGGAIAIMMSAVCLASWLRQREQKVVCSPWEQNRGLGDGGKRPESFEEAEKKYRYRKAAMRVDSAEGWHTEFRWDQADEDKLIAALRRQHSAYHAFITSVPGIET